MSEIRISPDQMRQWYEQELATVTARAKTAEMALIAVMAERDAAIQRLNELADTSSTTPSPEATNA